MILVFGRHGQVANELSKVSNVKSLDRNQANLLNPLSCYEIINSFSPVGVINAAAYTDVDKAESEEDIAKIINSDSPKLIAKACLKLKIPLIHISTDYVFNGIGSKPWKPNDLTCPLGAYGRRKLCEELEIRSSNCIHVILRTSWIFSEYRKNFVKSILDISDSKKEINVVSDQIGSPTPAKNLAYDCISILSQLAEDPSKTGTYHYCGNPDISRSDLASAILKLSKKNNVINPIASSDINSKALRPLNSRLDCSSTLNTFNIKKPEWRPALKKIVNKLLNKNE